MNTELFKYFNTNFKYFVCIPNTLSVCMKLCVYIYIILHFISKYFS